MEHTHPGGGDEIQRSAASMRNGVVCGRGGGGAFCFVFFIIRRVNALELRCACLGSGSKILGEASKKRKGGGGGGEGRGSLTGEAARELFHIPLFTAFLIVLLVRRATIFVGCRLPRRLSTGLNNGGARIAYWQSRDDASPRPHHAPIIFASLPSLLIHYPHRQFYFRPTWWPRPEHETPTAGADATPRHDSTPRCGAGEGQGEDGAVPRLDSRTGQSARRDAATQAVRIASTALRRL